MHSPRLQGHLRYNRPLMSSESISSTSVLQEQRRGLWVMRVLYFFYFGSIGAYWTYLNVYYKEFGLSGTQIGLVNTFGPLVSIFAATLWGLLNDRLGNPRLLVRIAVPGAILAALGLSIAQSYLVIILFSCMMSLFISAVIPLMDNTTLRLLGDQRDRYGRIRVGGSVGFILTSLASGYLYDITGLRWIFYSYAVLMGLLLLVAGGLPRVAVRISGSTLPLLGWAR